MQSYACFGNYWPHDFPCDQSMGLSFSPTIRAQEYGSVNWMDFHQNNKGIIRKNYHKIAKKCVNFLRNCQFWYTRQDKWTFFFLNFESNGISQKSFHGIYRVFFAQCAPRLWRLLWMAPWSSAFPPLYCFLFCFCSNNYKGRP